MEKITLKKLRDEKLRGFCFAFLRSIETAKNTTVNL